MKKIIILLMLFLPMFACQMESGQQYELKRAPLKKQKKSPPKTKSSPNGQSNRASKTPKIQFVNHDFEEVLAQAKQEDKVVFVDVYTDWCYPCKKMDKKVFTNNEAASFYNKNFINYKLNAKGQVNKKLARRYGVRAYPTLVYVNGDGEQLGSSIGYIDAKQLVDFGKEILRDFGGK